MDYCCKKMTAESEIHVRINLELSPVGCYTHNTPVCSLVDPVIIYCIQNFKAN